MSDRGATTPASPTGPATARRIVLSGRRLGLRARSTMAFALAALALSLTLSILAHAAVRSYLLSQRDGATVRQSLVNARLVRAAFDTEAVDLPDLMATLTLESDSAALLYREGDWFGSTLGVQPESIPADLVAYTTSGASGRQRFELDGETRLAVGVAIPGVDASYYEIYNLHVLDRTLEVLRNALIAASVAATLVGAGIGRYASRRVLHPLSRLAAASKALAHENLATRLGREADPDLTILVESFNEMADRLQERLERDARFAADVAHELRTPLTAISGAVELLQTRREELSPRGRQALDVLSGQVRRFDRMVVDLLELARIDARAAEIRLEETELVPFVALIVAHAVGETRSPLDVDPSVACLRVRIDKRRLERALANLVDNATTHGGGVVRIAITRGGGARQPTVEVAVEDAGRGIPLEDRDRIFERFARGTNARHRVGTGLGLSIVSEHVRLHGGTVRVEDRPGGGSRFVIALPWELVCDESD